MVTAPRWTVVSDDLKYCALPETIRGLVIDVDETLYTSPEYTRLRHELLVNKAADALGMAPKRLRARINEYRKDVLDAKRGNHDTEVSYSEVLRHLGVTAEAEIRWREEMYFPERYLRPNVDLQNSLTKLDSAIRVVALSNNPTSVARRAIASLGIDSAFAAVVGVDQFVQAKPHVAGFLLAIERLRCDADEIIGIGDRFEVDVLPIVAQGGGGAVVSGPIGVCEFLQRVK